MAAAAAARNVMLLNCTTPLRSLCQHLQPLRVRTRIRSTPSPKSLSIIANNNNFKPNHKKPEDIVIIGAGIAGLATAVSLHRLGIPSTVLEEGESLRTGGTSLTLSKNGWKVLDAIGVADQLRPQFLEIQGIVFKSREGRELRSLSFKEADESQELRAVERKTLLETLANQLPPNAISFSSKLSNISIPKDGETSLQLEDGARISAKIVIGCDGVRSPVAKWLGFSDPKYVGHCAFRGLGFYPDGQPFKPQVNYIYGRGIRAGFVPVSTTKVYWFIVYNSSSPSPKITDPSILKRQARELLKDWSPELLSVIDQTPDDAIVKNPLVDRWLWPGITPSASRSNIVVVGDAWHPMTPNLGQGACLALEDALVLSKKLAKAIKYGSTSSSSSVEDALKSYGEERWSRVFPLTIRSSLVGKLLQWENGVVCSFRDNILVPKLVSLGPLLKQTNVEIEPL